MYLYIHPVYLSNIYYIHNNIELAEKFEKGLPSTYSSTDSYLIDAFPNRNLVETDTPNFFTASLSFFCGDHSVTGLVDFVSHQHHWSL